MTIAPQRVIGAGANGCPGRSMAVRVVWWLAWDTVDGCTTRWLPVRVGGAVRYDDFCVI
ncbi:hypothetical protein GCM10008915_23800 [Bifidobacterium pullorum subsp. gallinarum]